MILLELFFFNKHMYKKCIENKTYHEGGALSHVYHHLHVSVLLHTIYQCGSLKM